MSIKQLSGLYSRLFIAGIALIMLGSVWVLSSSAMYAISRGSPVYYFSRHLFWLLLGGLCLLFMRRVSLLQRLPFISPFLLIGTVCLLAVAWDSRWIRLAGFSIQPSEFVKVALVCYLADYLARRDTEISSWKVLLKPLAVLIVSLSRSATGLRLSDCS